ncbi:MAG: DUF58 domain-containing protein [Ruminococcus sp.]|nr:DUF58 domain-containing protein [Ruminococcus sp.]
MIFIYLAALVISILFYILYVGNISFMIMAFTILLPFLLMIMNLIAKFSVKAQLTIGSHTCAADQSVPMRIILTNRSFIPVPMSEITICYRLRTGSSEEKMTICTPIFPLNSQTLTAGFSSKHYGIVECRIKSVRIYDLLRISSFKLPKRSFTGISQKVTVMPEALPLNNGVSPYHELGTDSQEFSQSKPGDDPSEIFAIREYADGDKLNRVHWKLTAKIDSLMVKEYSLPLVEGCMIVVDPYIKSGVHGREELYDTEIQLSFSLSMLLQSSDVRHRVAAYSDRKEALEQYTVFDEQTSMDGVLSQLSCGIGTERNAAAYALTAEEELSQRFGHLIYICSEFSQSAAEQLALCGRAYRYTVLLCCNSDDTPDIPDT